ncbi:MAG: hypothetical protein NDJ89_16945 [Oligoflexia bacterium]|nr:hypothetical protein [Oligoflexia bacterium]
MIDFGQAFTLSKSGPWSPDERILFTRFLRTLSEKDSAALKGLMLLSGEDYVPPQEFRRILSGEIKRLFYFKIPLLVRDACYAPSSGIDTASGGDLAVKALTDSTFSHGFSHDFRPGRRKDCRSPLRADDETGPENP